jgi:hypoxanthine phosphoribosyltransferase
MPKQVGEVLVTQAQIAQRVAQLGEQITRDFSPPHVPEDAKVVVVPIMTGAMVFCADLIRHMPLRLRIGSLRVSSYPGTSTSSQGVKVLESSVGEIAGRHVLLVDDILDSGSTLNAVAPQLRQQGALSVRTCVLLRKNRLQALATPADYIGFDIPDVFVVGYGLDFDDYYRNLPEVVTLHPDYVRSYNPATS